MGARVERMMVPCGTRVVPQLLYPERVRFLSPRYISRELSLPMSAGPIQEMSPSQKCAMPDAGVAPLTMSKHVQIFCCVQPSISNWRVIPPTPAPTPLPHPKYPRSTIRLFLQRQNVPRHLLQAAQRL